VVLFHELPTPLTWLGAALVTIGTLIAMSRGAQPSIDAPEPSAVSSQA